MNKQFVIALIASGALIGLGGCSEGDSATINIDAPTIDNSGSGNNGTDTPTEPPASDACPSGTLSLIHI